MQKGEAVSLPEPYYQDDACTIYCADCREVLPLIEADVMITDPPYGVNLGDHSGNGENRPGYLKKDGYDGYDDSFDNFKSVIVPVLTVGIQRFCRSAVFGIAPNIWELPAPAALGGVYLPAGCGRMVWGFSNLATIALYGKPPDLELGAKATTICSTAISEKNGHPCPKPLSWMNWLVGLCSRFEETIVDPFMGSGTTLFAAKLRGRKAIGIEINRDYCEIAKQRLAQGVLLTA